MRNETAIIIGAGPAGLTAAYELLTRAGIKPIVLECSEALGGISRTVNYKGNRIDIGGHRFFSKSDRVMNWWADMLPAESTGEDQFTITYQGKTRTISDSSANVDAKTMDAVMLVRSRKSRIFFLRKFFDYPISLSLQTVMNLGPVRMAKIGVSYLKSRLFPIRDEQNLEQFFINRFGGELYRTFFQSYTEKVWGVPCEQISAAWGAQRIKGLSITKAVMHAVKKIFRRDRTLDQKGTETSLIERFLYPKLGPGQMWETCAKKVQKLGGEVITNMRVEKLLFDGKKVSGVVARDIVTGETTTFFGDYFFSTMPVKELIRACDCDVPQNVREVSDGLIYRDFITVGLLLNELEIHEETPQGKKLLTDNWIYIQEPDVTVGRLQIFNNWSPYLVADSNKVWLGMEYFCNESDELWSLTDQEMTDRGVAELARMGFIQPGKVCDSTVIKVPKTYPAYFGSYDRFDEIRQFVDPIENLFLIGRNGMHRYNNQDHSMLTAMVSVDNILAGRIDKTNVWDVNTEQEYHETSDGTPITESDDRRRPISTPTSEVADLLDETTVVDNSAEIPTKKATGSPLPVTFPNVGVPPLQTPVS